MTASPYQKMENQNTALMFKYHIRVYIILLQVVYFCYSNINTKANILFKSMIKMRYFECDNITLCLFDLYADTVKTVLCDHLERDI